MILSTYMCWLIVSQARNYIQSLPALKRRDFREVFRGANPLAINLLELMLELDSDKWGIHIFICLFNCLGIQIYDCLLRV